MFGGLLVDHLGAIGALTHAGLAAAVAAFRRGTREVSEPVACKACP